MLNKLKELAEEKIISLRPHPTYKDVYVANYTVKVQMDRLWNRTTIMCRGLILNEERILGRPFKKFFNLEELPGLRNHLHNLYGVQYSELWNLPFTATAKEDGSLGILFRLPNNKWDFATRGSFESEQAELARKIWRDKYLDVPLDGRYTYLFEIVAPENRIVLKYDEPQLILIGVVETLTGKELLYDEISRLNLPFKRPQLFSFGSLSEASASAKDLVNAEGYVLDFCGGFKVKCKCLWYTDLHKIVTELSPRRVFEAMANDTIYSWLNSVPDEFYQDIRVTMTEITQKYTKIHDDAFAVFKQIECDNRKKFAKKANEYKHSSLLFALYDRKDIRPIVWKILAQEY